eukprot:6177212-Pleurochrysis_carterae.AAC.1
MNLSDPAHSTWLNALFYPLYASCVRVNQEADWPLCQAALLILKQAQCAPNFGVGHAVSFANEDHASTLSACTASSGQAKRELLSSRARGVGCRIRVGIERSLGTGFK